MIDGMLAGLVLALAWPALGYLLLGVFLGLWVGAVPGLGGAVGLALMLPFTFGMDPVPAFALLLGMYAVTSTSDSVASIMLGIPGTVASQATILDGYPLAKQGQAARAFGATYAVSAFGGVLGALLLAASLPVIMPVIFAFGVPEFFMLAVLGLTMVGVLSGRSLAKGLVAALLGLLITTVGYAEATGIPRFYFGVNYLLDGIPLIPIVLGLFGLPELMELAVKNTSIARVADSEDPGRGLLRGIRDAVRYRWLTLRSAVLGTYIGMLPGLGAAIVDWIAYGHAVQSAKDKSRFGRGDIRGVIAPESANNAHKAGALIPTVAFGIPGSIGTAILLGALVIKGLRPGPDMLTVNLPLTFSMVWAIVVANVVAAALLMFLARHVHKIAFVPGHLIVPGVITVLLMGTWVATNSMGDWWVCLGFGALGYWMKQGGWPRPPLILALVLGGLMENNFQLTTQIYGQYEWLYNRPIVVVIELLIVATIAFAIRGRRPGGKVSEAGVVSEAGEVSEAGGVTEARGVSEAGGVSEVAEVSEAGEGAKRNPLVSAPLAGGLLVAFAVAYGITRGFEQAATAQFPNAILIVALPLAAWVLISDAMAARVAVGGDGFASAWRAAADKAELASSARFIGIVLAIVGVTWLAGQLVALPLFVAAYLMIWGGYGWRIACLYAGVVLVVLWAFYGQLMGLLFHPSLLFG